MEIKQCLCCLQQGQHCWQAGSQSGMDFTPPMATPGMVRASLLIPLPLLISLWALQEVSLWAKGIFPMDVPECHKTQLSAVILLFLPHPAENLLRLRGSTRLLDPFVSAGWEMFPLSWGIWSGEGKSGGGVNTPKGESWLLTGLCSRQISAQF